MSLYLPQSAVPRAPGEKAAPAVERLAFRKPWLHVDAGPDHGLEEFCVQGQVPLKGQRNDDVVQAATLMVLVGSHKLMPAFWDRFGKTMPPEARAADYHQMSAEQLEWFKDQGCEVRRVSAPAGSMVLWQSNLVHCGVEATADTLRAVREGRLDWREVRRVTTYVCMLPVPAKVTEAEATKLDKRRLHALHVGNTTSHHPFRFRLFPSKPLFHGNAKMKMYNRPPGVSLAQFLAWDPRVQCLFGGPRAAALMAEVETKETKRKENAARRKLLLKTIPA